WEVEVWRSRVRVWTDQGTALDFPNLTEGESVLGKWGYSLKREAWGWIVDAGDGLKRLFSFSQAGERRDRRARLTALEDRNGNRIALTYDDANGRLLEVADSAGRRIRLRNAGSAEEQVTAIELQIDAQRGEWLSLGTLTRDAKGDLVA